jgi:DNA-binding transcriptional LysR family regulator
MRQTHQSIPPAPEPTPGVHALEALCAMLAHRTTAAAARALGLSQSAVSRALAGLERDTGRTLFRRDGMLLVPTAEALAMGADAARILADLKRLLRPASGEGVAALQIVTTATLAEGVLAPLLPGLMAAWPGLTLSVEIAASGAVVTAVADGAADLGLLDQFRPHGSLSALVLRAGEAAVLLPPGHPLAERPEIGVAELAAHPLIALPRRFLLRAVLDRMFREAGLAPQIVVESATSAFAADLVASGLGVAVLNPFPVAALRPGLVLRPFRPAIRLDTALVTAASLPLRPAVARLAELLRPAFDPTPPPETNDAP